MPRRKWEEGHVRPAGKRRRIWVGEYHTYDTANKRHHHTVELGLRAEISKADARIKLREVIQRERGQFRPAAEITFAEWTVRYLEIKAGQWTRNSREHVTSQLTHHALPILGPMRLREIRKSDVQLLLAGMASKYARATIKATLSCIKAALRAAEEDKLIEANPAYRVKAPASQVKGRDNRALSLGEARRLIVSLSGQDRLMARMMLATGCRLGELFALRRDSVAGAAIRIERGSDRGEVIATKNKRVRSVPLPRSLQAELDMWLETIPDAPEAILFPGSHGRVGWRHTEGKQFMQRMRQASGIADLTFHSCRRTYATLLDADAADVRDLLGHSNVSTTLEHYRKPLVDRQRRAVEDLDARLRDIDPN